ncbi:MAG TPA: energy transducer TonB, partial [Bryobacteraceae bacterium]|nr:energy transducer TonB [Bryobacteraceae bacterium]
GPGAGGGWGRGARGSVATAVVLYQVEPEYSEEARKARVQGTVAVMIEIDEAGRVRNPRLRSTLGMGLDERALEAVRRWRFRPYLRDGKPVAGPALVELRFRLL